LIVWPETLHLHRQSKYAIGRDERVADIKIAHLSCSLQHAVIQYRRKELVNELGVSKLVVKYASFSFSPHVLFNVVSTD